MKHCILFLCLMLPASALAQMPRTLNYQGTLATSSGLVPDGNYSVTFRLYTASSGGSAVWTEAQLVSTRTGVFNALLGKIIPLPAAFNTSYWMSLQVGADPELAPRLEMAGVSYSLQSAVSDSSRKVGDGSIGSTQLANASITPAKLDGSGSAASQVLSSTGTSAAWRWAGLVNYYVTGVIPTELGTVSETYTKIGDFATFNKISGTSVLEVHYDGRVAVESMSGGTGATFQIRIDSLAPSLGFGVAEVRPNEAGTNGVPTHMIGFFTGLPAGNHTISIWCRQWYGTATNAYVNPGGWPDQLLIKEIN